MKKLQTKIVSIIFITLIIFAIIIPTKVLGANEDLQIIFTEKGDYIIYVKDLAKTEFYFAISENKDEDILNLNDTIATLDEEGNRVVLITAEQYEKMDENKTYYLYIKTSATATSYMVKELDFTDSFNQEKMKEVEETTERISTMVEKEILEFEGEEEGKDKKVTVGALKITDSEDAKYYFSINKVEKNDEYAKIIELAEKLNGELDRYSKIAIEKEFYTLYHKLENEQKWKLVENMQIKQPSEAKNEDKYVVYIKKVNKDGTEITDAKLMTSYRVEDEGINEIKEEKEVKKTSKLPITGDSIILFVILTIIIIVSIMVFIRIKKLETKKEEK